MLGDLAFWVIPELFCFLICQLTIVLLLPYLIVRFALLLVLPRAVPGKVAARIDGQGDEKASELTIDTPERDILP
jgi:hypothetical protein